MAWKWSTSSRRARQAAAGRPHRRRPRSSKYVALTLEEADELRAKLNEFIAAGRDYVQPEAVASLQELIDCCGVRVVECESAPKGFYGPAVGGTRQGGPVWVTVPRDTT
ncbi:hypothetical protein ACWGI9_17710 [Streptomyces sp. NPDC054833]